MTNVAKWSCAICIYMWTKDRQRTVVFRNKQCNINLFGTKIIYTFIVYIEIFDFITSLLTIMPQRGDPVICCRRIITWVAIKEKRKKIKGRINKNNN